MRIKNQREDDWHFVKKENEFFHRFRQVTVISPLLFIFLILSPVILRAQLTSEQTSAARSEQRQQVEGIKKIKRKVFQEQPLAEKTAPKTFIQKFDFHYAAMEGFDQNVRLNPDQLKGSFYTKQEVAAGFTNHIKNIFIYRLSYSLNHTYYYKFSGLNILNQHFNAETALKLLPNLFLETGYRFEIFRRQHESFADYNGNQVKVGLKHYLIKDKLYHKPSYIFRHHGYGKFEARNAEGVPGSKDRKDNLNAFDYEIGMYLFHQVLIRLHNQFGRNDSNDQFKDFFDYSYYAVTPIVSWHVTKKWLLTGGFHYQYNHYDDRNLHGSAEREHVYSFFAGTYYQINQYLTWNVDCVYVQADSNIPELEYKDPIYSTGIHLHF